MHIHQALYKIPALIYLLNKYLWRIYQKVEES